MVYNFVQNGFQEPKPVIPLMRLICSFSLITLFILQASILLAQETIHHEIKLKLDIENNSLEAEDMITVPRSLSPPEGEALYFSLHGDLRVDLKRGKEFRLRELYDPITPSDVDSPFPLRYYSLVKPSGGNTFLIKYKGKIDNPIKDEPGDSQGKILQTLGNISSEGVFLSGASFWYPSFGSSLVTFRLEIQIQNSWEVISQGERTRHHQEGNWKMIHWETKQPQDEILLVGGSFHEYGRSNERVEALAFLRTPDEKLADKYLDATLLYLDLYRQLIGPYPYKKFALVENFQETGLGMPSFTLLGSRVIRLPFILHSSYPHEILHNWWGNSVYINNKTGNWAEGLTSYLADHLIKEQNGKALEYRRATLQKYTDFVSSSEDFPLTAFRSRHSQSSQAVGYGKTMMFFHMLRLQMGEKAFIQALKNLYQEQIFKRTSYSDLERIFVAVGGKEIKPLFYQWIRRTGAPILELGSPELSFRGNQYQLTAPIQQTQFGPAYSLKVPIAVYMENQTAPYQTQVSMTKKDLELKFDLPFRPVRLDIDPEFDIFRRLDKREISPALSGPFGSDKVLMLLPSAASKALRKPLKRLALSFRYPRSATIETQWDKKLDELPSDQSIWIFGWDNRFISQIHTGLSEYDALITKDKVRIGKEEFHRDQHSVVLTLRHPLNPDLTITWVGADLPKAIPGLGRKLPHYTKYSYLVFEGEEPVNITKGQWPINKSPMKILIPLKDGTVEKQIKENLAPRSPLASLPALPTERTHKAGGN